MCDWNVWHGADIIPWNGVGSTGLDAMDSCTMRADNAHDHRSYSAGCMHVRNFEIRLACQLMTLVNTLCLGQLSTCWLGYSIDESTRASYVRPGQVPPAITAHAPEAAYGHCTRQHS